MHSPFIWDVLKDSLVELRTHMTFPNPNRLWKADFSKCLPTPSTHTHIPYSTGKVRRLSRHQPTPILQNGGHNGKTCRLSKEAGLNGLCCLCILNFWEQGLGCWHHYVRSRERRAKWCMTPVEPSSTLWPVLCVSVLFCHNTPSLFAKYLKVFPEGSELLTDLGKMLRKTPSTKTDLSN